jgi:hypothetical protein
LENFAKWIYLYVILNVQTNVQYGNFTRTADKAGMPKPTLRDLILRGYGRVETVQKIRTILNEAA